MSPTPSVPARVILGAIAFYRRAISPWTGRHCRYEPTCSAYAYEAVRRHGTGRGLRLGIRRIAHCHPWAPGGVDPVPEHLHHGGQA